MKLTPNHSLEYMQAIGVADIPPLTCPFDPGYDPLTVESHIEQSPHLMASTVSNSARYLLRTGQEKDLDFVTSHINDLVGIFFRVGEIVDTQAAAVESQSWLPFTAGTEVSHGIQA